MCCSKCSARFRSSAAGREAVRVGGPLTPEQQRLAERLNVVDAIVAAAVSRAAAARRAVPPRVGCRAAIRSRRIRLARRRGDGVRHAGDRQRHPALREVGGGAALYRPPGDVDWLGRRRSRRLQREQRRRRRARAPPRGVPQPPPRRFDWRHYAARDDDAVQQPLREGAGVVKVLHLGKFYPPAKGGMETILALICERTARHVRTACSSRIRGRRPSKSVTDRLRCYASRRSRASAP